MFRQFGLCGTEASKWHRAAAEAHVDGVRAIREIGSGFAVMLERGIDERGANNRTLGARLASRRMDAALELEFRGEATRYPRHAMFAGADLPGIGDILTRCTREHTPVVLVFPDGEERIIDHASPERRWRRSRALRLLRRRSA